MFLRELEFERTSADCMFCYKCSFNGDCLKKCCICRRNWNNCVLHYTRVLISDNISVHNFTDTLILLYINNYKNVATINNFIFQNVNLKVGTLSINAVRMNSWKDSGVVKCHQFSITSHLLINFHDIWEFLCDWFCKLWLNLLSFTRTNWCSDLFLVEVH